MADDEKPASSADTGGQAQGQGQEKKPRDPAGRQVPAQKSGQSPGAAAPPAKPGGVAPKAAPPAPEPTLRFTDLDLERYHRPIPREEEVVGEEPDENAAAGGTPAGGRTAAAPRPAGKARPVAKEPGPDPLQPFKDREAKEKFRRMQIETARDRIAKLQARLDYLNVKKNALENPAPLLVGRTRGPGTPPNPIGGPGKVPIGGFFPPVPPPQTDEDKENDRKLRVKDLLKQVEDEIKTVQEELGTARDELASVETRFAQESPSR